MRGMPVREVDTEEVLSVLLAVEDGVADVAVADVERHGVVVGTEGSDSGQGAVVGGFWMTSAWRALSMS